MTILYFQYFQLFSLLLAIVCRKGLNSFSIGILIPILLLDNIADILGVNDTLIFHSVDNYFIYNIYFLISTPLYLYLFTVMFNADRLERRRILLAGLAIESFMLVNYFFIQGMHSFDSFNSLLVNLTDFVFSCLVLTRLAIRKEEDSLLFTDPGFWLNTLILLFSLTSMVGLGLQEYIMAHHIQLGGKSLYIALMQAANAVLYAGYSGAIILCQKQRSK
jgi:hypothetical protein